MPRRGVVIGKFYPPHRGHKHLIDYARARVDQLTVILCQRPEEDPHGNLRAAWLREIHPDADILPIDDVLGPDDSEGWARYTIQLLGAAPDVVFSSEEYGPRWAGFMGCEHVLVDHARSAVPISGTLVRQDPLGCWEFLEPPVRAHYAKRVILIGAESTGKTTLAEALARHYNTVWVPEYGRDYAAEKMAGPDADTWRSEEFLHIARTQCAWEDRAARDCNRLLVCDTDAFATSIWHRRYTGERSSEVEALVESRRPPHLYLLTDIHTPFVQDGTRDGEHIREWMHGVFVEALEARSLPYVLVTGNPEQRLDLAARHIETLQQ
jgi:NadR type nicotinamide-nucleotide adenylyltransferase